jgi:hypothetical protein
MYVLRSNYPDCQGETSKWLREFGFHRNCLPARRCYVYSVKHPFVLKMAFESLQLDYLPPGYWPNRTLALAFSVTLLKEPHVLLHDKTG